MYRKVIDKVQRALSTIRFKLLILRWCGLHLFLRKIVHQLYRRTIFLVSVGTHDNHHHQYNFKCTVKLASPDEIEELFKGISTESPEGRYQLLVRKWYHDRGFGDCFIARADDTKEICGVRWLVNSEHIRKLGWEDRLPLDKNEYMLENLYTFKRYRRKGVHLVSGLEMQ